MAFCLFYEVKLKKELKSFTDFIVFITRILVSIQFRHNLLIHNTTGDNLLII